jgi:Pyruvate/2-oxoacid:ferredoxin oxidoreductase delta subunit
MNKAFIDSKKCGYCAECKAARACPYKAITQIDRNESSVVDSTYCRGCGDCIDECPASAIVLKMA